MNDIYMSCGRCHKKEVNSFFKSNHFLLKKCINETADIWKAKKYDNGILDIAKENVNEYDSDFLTNTKKLFVDFIRRRCLFCHFLNEGEKGFGIRRKSFCFACHQKKQGKSFSHTFTKDISNEACLMCHNRNRVGIDFIGLSEEDYMENTRTPYPTKYEYGSSYRYLVDDIHHKYGFKCIDCHNKENVMGDKKGYSCIDCHGDLYNQPKIKKMYISDKWLFPKRFKPSINHSKYHQRLHCSACHSVWSFQDYGFYLILDFSKELYWYFERKALQGIIPIYHTIKREAKKIYRYQQNYPTSIDGVNLKWRDGIWYQEFLERRFEDPPLGMKENIIYIVRPFYHYYITTKDRYGNVYLDNLYLGAKTPPYIPHTTQKGGRYCLSCHLNKKVIGIKDNKNFLIYKLINTRSSPFPQKIKKQLLKETSLFKKNFSIWIKNNILNQN